MKEKIDKRLVLMGLAIIILLVGLYFVFRNSKDKEVDIEDNKNTTSTTTNISSNATNTKIVDLGNGIVAVGKGDFKVEQITDVKVVFPDLTKPVSFSSSLDEQTKQIIKSKIDEVKASLLKDNTTISKWMDLGMYYKIAGDFAGASVYWKFVLSQSPKDLVTLLNLADLYSYHLKDVNTGIGYYKEAIKDYPKSAEIYVKLADVYKTIFLDNVKAVSVLDQGLSLMPDNQMLISAKSAIK
jgi:tetratricopeptide (TPR) repeat protein